MREKITGFEGLGGSMIWSVAALFLLAGWIGAEEPKGIEKMKQKFGLARSVADLTPTVCDLASVPRPPQTATEAIPEVKEGVEKCFDGPAEKILIFCPDAIGDVQFRNHPDDFAPLTAKTDLRVLGTNVLPSVTPVCFATIFTGAPPEVHGIQVYDRPVLKIETLFDVFDKAGKKVAIFAKSQCSIDLIFRQRKIEYHSFPSNKGTFDFTRFVLENRTNSLVDYDLIVCYDGGYDSTMHSHGVAAPESLTAMRTSIQRFLELVELTDDVWSGYNRVLIFAPDHGSHDVESGKGKHGTDSADDVLVNHFYRFRPAAK